MKAILALIIPVVGVALFTYILARRMAPLFRTAQGPKIDRIKDRILALYHYPHHRMPRYYDAGAIHITTIVSLIVLSLHVIMVVLGGISEGFRIPGTIGVVYDVLADIALTVLLGVCIVAAVRRGYFKPARYDVPEKYGKDKSRPEAVLLVSSLGLLAVLDMIYLGSSAALDAAMGIDHRFLLPVTGTWFAKLFLSVFSASSLKAINFLSFILLDIGIFAFLCALPFGRLFHLFTGPITVFLVKLKKGSIKPVRWGVEDDKLDELESFGVKNFEDFTWKHVLDFYSCTDCGRCSDHCPANAVGRPLSPRFISIKGRNYAFKHYPVKGQMLKGEPLIGTIYDEHEIWSCTTCGACEEECPVTIEYIDKIVDLRRGMVDEGMVPQSLQKPLSALEKRGNPWGKMEKKRADWTKDLPEDCTVENLEKGGTTETLYFVDSISSFDDRMQDLAKATAAVLCTAGEKIGILGKSEKDAGNEVRRFGEEMLFQDLKNHNTDMILESGAKKIVTSDPHALNVIKKDYNNSDLPPIQHLSEFVMDALQQGRIKFKSVEQADKVYTYHDPCYLGRHNEIYDAPRQAMDAIPGLKRVDMERCKDRSFCCGGGGLMLFYEPEEEERMGVLRVRMAKEAGANVIVTACPFCLVNMEDAIKVAGLEGQMEAIDLSELLAQHAEKA